MSAEEDTFEIDIYGDEPHAAEEQSGTEQATETPSTFDGDPKDHGRSDVNPATPTATTETESWTTQADGSSQRGTKRTYDEHEMDDEQGRDGGATDDRPVEAGATTALKLAELHWWTTEEDLRAFCAQCHAEEELRELAFGEHKINGKSKGEAYLEFATTQAASAVKRRIEEASQSKGEDGLRKTPFAVSFTHTGNPHRSSAAAGVVKKDFSQSTGRGGAYNNFNPRGNFGSRGNYNNRGGGGGGYNNAGMQGRNNAQAGGWAMNGMGGANFGGGFAGPMMAGGFGNMMGNFGNMARGGMMNGMGMMGRGGFGGMANMSMGGMGMSNMMGGRGAMGGRGGWNGAGGQFQSQGGSGFGGNMQQGGNAQGNKRPRTDQ